MEGFDFLFGDDGAILRMLSQIGLVEVLLLFGAILGLVGYDFIKTDRDMKKTAARDDSEN